MLNTIIHDNGIEIKRLEEKIYNEVCRVGCEIMSECLEKYDQELMIQRDRTIYRHKGTRPTTLKTLMGEVSYERIIYQTTDEDGKHSYVYLLDQEIGTNQTGLISENLAEKIIEMVCQMSYKETAKKVSELTGQRISHGGVWNLTQNIGKTIEQHEEVEKQEWEKGIPRGSREVKVLFEEADGVMLRMQGKDRKKGKIQEMKIAILHEGWKQEGRNRYRLYKKEVVSGFEKMSEFSKRKEARIASIYNRDEISYRIYNCDGAKGLKTLAEEDSICQLDPFHVKQAIIRSTRYKSVQKELMELYENCQTETLLDTIESYANSMEGNEEEALWKLYNYLRDNQKELIPYQKRGLPLPQAPIGIEYRAMGACEHNVYLTSAQRMKHRGASWSKSGANHLGKILALKTSGRISKAFQSIPKRSMIMRKEEELSILSSSKAPKIDGAGYEGMVCPRPFCNSALTNGTKAIKNMFNLQPFSNIKYQ